MMKLAISVAVAILASTSAFAKPPSQIQLHYAALMNVDDEILEEAGSYDSEALVKAFERDLAPLDLAKVQDEDLEPLFRATLLVASRTFQSARVGKARAVFDEMRRRSLLHDAHYVRMASLYLATWDAEHASELNQALPAARRIVIPKLEMREPHASGLTVMSLTGSAGDWTLARRPLAFSRRQVVIIATPACSFAQKFVRDMKTEPELAGYVKRSQILFPQATDLLISKVHDWNQSNPDYRFDYMYATSDWPGIAWWETPQFYFLQDGKVEARIVGWQGEQTRQQLLRQYRGWWRQEP